MSRAAHGKLVILSAPSGSGKTTIMRRLLERFPRLEFSVSATSRAPRNGESDGVDYFFLSPGQFASHIEGDEFVEWEEVYPGTHYGTLRREVDRIWTCGNVVIFDVDVKGGLRLKEIFGEAALAIFIMPPSMDELHKRLLARATDTPESIARRVGKAEQEIAHSPHFDLVVVNEDLDRAVGEIAAEIERFIDNE